MFPPLCSDEVRDTFAEGRGAQELVERIGFAWKRNPYPWGGYGAGEAGQMGARGDSPFAEYVYMRYPALSATPICVVFGRSFSPPTSEFLRSQETFFKAGEAPKIIKKAILACPEIPCGAFRLLLPTE